MKRLFTLLCGTIALFCLVSMFIPIIAPRYSASIYRLSSEAGNSEYVLEGDYYQAREYWSIAKYALVSPPQILQVMLYVSMGLTIYWCVLSFLMEDAFEIGVAASALNLFVTAFFIIRMQGVSGGSRWGVMVTVLVDAVAAVVVAVAAIPDKRRYTRPIHIKFKK